MRIPGPWIEWVMMLPSRAARRLCSAHLSLIIALQLAPVLASPGVAAETPRPTVILISLDGTRPQDVVADDLPSLVALAARGAQAERLIPAMPSNTFPNHVTLVTGVAPERHGMVDNAFRDPERGVFEKQEIPSWIEVEPLWSLLEGEGITTASYHWVGSEGRWRSGRGPSHWKPFSNRTPVQKKVDQILAWLDLPEHAGRPHFITSWWNGADHAGHDHGPGSKQVKRALRRQDPALAALVAGLDARQLFESTTLIVVSDHGMAEAARRVDLQSILAKAGIEARVFGIGGFASLELSAAARLDPALRRQAVALARSHGLDAFERADAPASARLGNPRFGAIVVRAPLGTAIVRSGLELQGFHGYAPEEPAMAALFVAAGRGVAPGTRLPSLRAMDVAPSVLALLGVAAPDWMEGQAIQAIVPVAAASATLSDPRREPAGAP